MLMDVDFDDDTPNRCTTLVYYAWKIFTCLFLHVLLVTMVVLYCLLGAFAFERLESANEIEVKNSIRVMRMNVTTDLWKYTKNSLVLQQDNFTTNVTARLQKFEDDLIYAIKRKGWDGEEDTKIQQWTFTGALFYSIIVITTIGYGHIAPKTLNGKIATIFYAIVGIPLMLLCLSNIGDIMAHSFRFLYWKVCCYTCTRRQRRVQSLRRSRSQRSTTRSHGGSRTTSLKRTGRISQRSADSALGMSDCYTRSSYSDTECRYYDKMEREYAMFGGGMPVKAPNRYSQQSRYSDTVPLRRHSPAIKPRSTSQNSGHRNNANHYYHGRYRVQDPSYSDGDQLDGPELQQVPSILFNKYALDREESRRSKRLEVMAPSPRIMSPLGFAVNRQYPRRSTRYNDYYDDMEPYEFDDNNPDHIKPVPIWLCVLLVVSYIIMGAFLFKSWENWEFPDSAYFCFITLTTIGFGDFVPAQRVMNKGDDTKLRIWFCSLYLLFGIALLAMSFNLVQEEVISNVKTVARHLGIIKDEDEEESE
ncbi:uncharacterized protein LOC100164681 isoform X3 [Acyrthosiphon pisum]|uniref:Potassium channel domain-containing protein n=1 Tax=Acyrthosiphon pisum TaxID=7029 RepID=A0A8R2D660_ACYPI|nr:uncharacterized protein LOC100164681 isoform X3 [Acyrthosiphon pisum]|eukprot:XP_016663209.1 PREDICTED: uncharacterized protein LOC100164681 isoform X3 [Acyrthosiphon pisum]